MFTSFDSTKDFLSALLNDVRNGNAQLPDFQRGWVWDDENIRSLLSSISLSYPIGAIMLLEAGNPDVRLKVRPIEGVTLQTSVAPKRLILDGQQRLTSLYQSLASGKAVLTKDATGRAIERWYYIDVAKALTSTINRDETIISVPADKQFRNFQGKVEQDVTTTEKECVAGLLPLPLVFDVAGFTNWMMCYINIDPQQMVERLALMNRVNAEIVQRFQQYQVPVITLGSGTPKEAVCQVFEKVNTRGVSLTVFELLTATYAVDDFNLRDDWTRVAKQIYAHKVLASVENTDFLQAVTLLAAMHRRAKDSTAFVLCRRSDVLRLPFAEYCTYANAAAAGFERAAKFLHTQHVYSRQDLPYRTQVVPLAVLYALHGHALDTDATRTKLAHWFWCGVFGELYGGAVETRIARDAVDVTEWLRGGLEPKTVTDCTFSARRLLTLRSRNSAAYKGLNALLLREGALDFRSGDPIDVAFYYDERIDIHHIFPRDYCIKHDLDAKRYESVVNKTPLSARTNKMIGGRAPSLYLQTLRNNYLSSQENMERIVASHVIDVQALASDNFDAFFDHRFDALIGRIERATGKPVVRDFAQPEPTYIDEDYEATES